MAPAENGAASKDNEGGDDLGTMDEVRVFKDEGDIEEEDFFVVRKPTQQSEWSGFASFAKEDSKDDFDILLSHSWADDKDDDFATGWDDSGFEEVWTPVAVQKKTIPFSSPTSVATSKQTVTF